MSATTTAHNAVASLNNGGIGMFEAVRILLATADLPSDDVAVLAAMKVRNALAPLDDESII